MIISLYIKNFILIEEVKLELNKGFCTITGDTGSGKSLILDAILFCLGGKFKNDIVRAGTAAAIVSIEFSSDCKEIIEKYLSELNIYLENDENLIITRTIQKDGKKKFSINNSYIASKNIEYIAQKLVSFYGQHSYGDLIDYKNHINLLDKFGNLSSLKKEVSDIFKSWNKFDKELKNILEKEENIKIEAEYLEYCIKEIEAAKIEENEEEKLTNLRSSIQLRLKNKKKFEKALSIFKDNEIQTNLFRAQKILSDTNNLYDQDKLISRIDQAEILVSEIESELNDILNNNFEEFDIESIESRLFFIKSLARKYNVSSCDLTNLLNQYKDDYMKIMNFESNKKKLCDDLKNSEIEYCKLSQDLRDKRILAAKKFEKEVENQLDFLKMKGCKFSIEIKDLNEKSTDGSDIVRFAASTNLGMPFDYIEKIASGGELSRFMLAILVVLNSGNNDDSISDFKSKTIIFDEIDTGIGGSVADAVGERLKFISEKCQIISITHQPQVAAKSNTHILVEKKQKNDSTISIAKTLSSDEKIQEIARMLSGKFITDNSTSAAKDLINM